MPGDQIPWSVIATIPWHLLHIIMSISKITASAPIMFMGTLVLALSTISAAVIVPKVLEGQTRKQCKLNDWPAESHAVHMEFCQSHGYPTNWFVKASPEVQTLRQLLPQSRGKLKSTLLSIMGKKSTALTTGVIAVAALFGAPAISIAAGAAYLTHRILADKDDNNSTTITKNKWLLSTSDATWPTWLISQPVA